MKQTDPKPLLMAVCEALYHLRSLGPKIPPAFAKIHVPYALRALEGAARMYGDLGQTSTTADCAKMMLGATADGGAAYCAARAEEKPSQDPAETALRRAARAQKLIADLLEDAQDADDSLSIFKTLSRFAEFCERARYAGAFTDLAGRPHAGLIPDDPVLPVVPWLQQRGRFPLREDLTEAAEMYLCWAEEAARQVPASLHKIVPRNPGRPAILALIRQAVLGADPRERAGALRALLRAAWGSHLAMLDAREALEGLVPGFDPTREEHGE